MKAIYIFIFCLVGIMLNAQIINFPDANFKLKLVQASTSNQTAGGTVIDLNGNGEIEQSEALEVTYLFLVGSNISDLTGVEYFTNLQYLFVNNNSLTDLNISSLTQLIIFRCDVNNLFNLDLTGLIALEGINISYNNFVSIDFSGLPSLESVTCSNNQLSTLDFSSNPLIELWCRNNNLSSLNLKNGINQDFTINPSLNDCWKTGNPNLTTICVDESEAAAVQNHLDNCGTEPTPTLTTNCSMGTDEFADLNVMLYPNPAQDRLIISGNPAMETLEIYDGHARLLCHLAANGGQAVLDVSGYAAGMYFVKAIGANGVFKRKFVKR